MLSTQISKCSVLALILMHYQALAFLSKAIVLVACIAQDTAELCTVLLCANDCAHSAHNETALHS